MMFGMNPPPPFGCAYAVPNSFQPHFNTQEARAFDQVSLLARVAELERELVHSRATTAAHSQNAQPEAEVSDKHMPADFLTKWISGKKLKLSLDYATNPDAYVHIDEAHVAIFFD